MKEFILLTNEPASEFSEELHTRFDVQSRFEQEFGLDMGHDYFLQIESPS